MFVLQCALVALFCMSYGYMWSILGPIVPVYMLGKPLVGGLICGIIFGDVPLGLEIGCAIQLGYLAYLVIGGSSSADQGFLSYPIVALAIVNKLDAGTAIALGATVAAIVAGYFGTTVKSWNVLSHKIVQDGIAKNNYKKIWFGMRIMPLVILFLIRFVPAFAMVYFGTEYVNAVVAMLPEKLLYAFKLFGKYMPAVGVAALLTTTVKEPWYLLFFVIGFTMGCCLGLSVVASAIISAGLALLYYMIATNKVAGTAAAVAGSYDDEEVL